MSEKPGQAVSADWYKTYFSEPYGEVYSDYLLPPEMTLEEAALARRALDLRPSDRILDCPCGYGRHLEALRKDFPLLAGLDLDGDCLRRAAERTPGGPLARGDMRALPFPDGSFDVVLHLFNSFGYFSARNNGRVLREFARTLRPGGKLLLDTVNPGPLREAVRESPVSQQQIHDMTLTESWSYDARTRRVVNHTLIRLGDREFRRSYAVRLYSLNELRRLFETAGLEVREVFGETNGAAYDTRQSDRLIVVGRRV